MFTYEIKENHKFNDLKAHFELNYKTLKSLEISVDKKTKERHSDAIYTLDIEQTTLFLKDDKTYDFESAMNLIKRDRKKLIKEFKPITHCYLWQFGIYDSVYYGRDIESLSFFIDTLKTTFNLNSICVWVYNLGYEFQTIKRLFNWSTTKFFTRSARKPMYVTTDEGTQFRDAMILANNLPLARLTSQYNLPVEKKSGDLDYDLIRHKRTPLTQKELDYAFYDILVLYHFIKFKKEEAKKARTNVKLTSTGDVRHLMKKSFSNIKYQQDYVSKVTPDYKVYMRLVEAMQGGETHANMYHSNIVKTNVKSRDEKSKYPHVMITEKYPMTRFTKLSTEGRSYEDIRRLLELRQDTHAFIIDYTMHNLESMYCNTKISLSKCYEKTNAVVDNGRVRKATMIKRITTELDFLLETELYDYSSVEINSIYYSKKDYLPKNIIILIISMFIEKEVIGKALSEDPNNAELDSKYRQVKARINSMFGCTITNYIGDKIDMFENGVFHVEHLTPEMIESQLYTLIEDSKLFLPYQWGVYITAYARRDLWEVIKHIDKDIIYYDTDSTKYENWELYEEFFEELNKCILDKNKRVSQELGIDFSQVMNIGTWELDSFSKNKETGETSDVYYEFKTMGAKKYCYRDVNGLHITLSGVGKGGHVCLENDINNFRKGFVFDERAKKKSICYTDIETKVTIRDYLGQELEVYTNTGIAIYPEVYTLGMTYEYEELLNIIADSKSRGSLSFKLMNKGRLANEEN